MNINTLISEITQAIATDNTLRTWSLSTYDQVHKVYVNADAKNQPGEADCPFVVLFPSSKVVGETQSTKYHELVVMCVVNDSSASLENYGLDNVTEYAGVVRLETFRKYVESAISTEISSDSTNFMNVSINMVEVNYETMEEFPFMVAEMLIGFTEDVPIGSDYLL